MSAIPGLTFHGYGLNRPECVLAHQSGCLIAPDWTIDETGSGGVSIITGAGEVSRVLARDWSQANPLRPNGIALEADGSILCCHLGADTGGVFRLWPDGSTETVLDRVEGKPLPPTNFAQRDTQGRLWVTVSTRKTPRALGYRPGLGDGFIIRQDATGTAIAADDLGYTNECLITPDGQHLFVNETFGRRLSRFDIGADGALRNRTDVALFGAGTYPDGLAADAVGGLWITSIVSNRVIRVGPEGSIVTMLEDVTPDHIDWTEAAFQAGDMDRPHLDTPGGTVLRNISNLAFGGPNLTTAYLGCLLDDRIASFEAAIPGAEPAHWRYPIDAWLQAGHPVA